VCEKEGKWLCEGESDICVVGGNALHKPGAFSNNIYCQTGAERLRSARGLPWGYSKHVKLISKL
jgi:hypothetical protein